MATLSNQYQLIDTSSAAAGPAGGNTGGGSSIPLSPVWTDATIGAAMQRAWIICTALQRPGALVAFGGSPPWTIVTGGPAATAITASPSGVGY